MPKTKLTIKAKLILKTINLKSQLQKLKNKKNTQEEDESIGYKQIAKLKKDLNKKSDKNNKNRRKRTLYHTHGAK